MDNIINLDIKRIQGLSDAVFAVAMTILILDIHVPTGLQHLELKTVLIKGIMPALFVYSISFIVLGAFWVDSHFHHHLLVKTDRFSSWLTILFLMFICIIPFSASFLNKYRREELSIAIYSTNLIFANITHVLMLQHSWRKNYIKPHISSKLYKNMQIRILVPTIMYAIIIIASFLNASWIRAFFLIPLIFHVLWGRSGKEITKSSY